VAQIKSKPENNRKKIYNAIRLLMEARRLIEGIQRRERDKKKLFLFFIFLINRYGTQGLARRRGPPIFDGYSVFFKLYIFACVFFSFFILIYSSNEKHDLQALLNQAQATIDELQAKKPWKLLQKVFFCLFVFLLYLFNFTK